jgi:alcohol dehydrogenase (cytochrome c)
MCALDAKTGTIVWEFYLVPKTDGDPARGPQGSTPLEISTWKNAAGIPISGGGAWTSYTLDPATGQCMSPTAIRLPTSRSARARALPSVRPLGSPC